VVNEGNGTARIRLDGEAQFVDGTSSLVNGVTLAAPPVVGTPDRREHLLRPGDMALFEWAHGHTLGDWADARENPDPPNPRGACFFTITVFDFFEHGVVDRIHIVMAGRPLLQVPGAAGQWVIPDKVADAEMGMTIYPIRRAYTSEALRNEPLPWEDTYGQWWRQNENR
jgi:hypothetical protein